MTVESEDLIRTRLSELEVGRIFDGDEVIMKQAGGSMTTLRRTPDTEEIRIFCYDLRPERSGDYVEVRCNGHDKVTPEDKGRGDEYKALSDFYWKYSGGIR